MNEWKTHNLEHTQIADMLRLCCEPQTPTDQNEQRIDILDEWLAQPVAATKGKLIDLLQSAQPLLDALVETKHVAKAAYKEASEPLEREVANIIYYAAIAAALVGCNRKISAFAPARLVRAFKAMQKLPWLPEWLGNLFHRAESTAKTLA